MFGQAQSCLACWPPRLGYFHDHRYSRLSLRFVNAQTEKTFALRREERISFGLKVCGACAVVLGVVGVLTHENYHPAYNVVRPDISQLGEAYLINRYAHILIACWGVFMLVFSHVQQSRGFLPPTCTEVIVVAMFIALLGLCFSTEQIFVLKLLGVEDTMVPGHTQDFSWWLLVINTILSATHTLVPVRFCIVFPIEFAAVMAYAVPATLLPMSNGRDHREANLPTLVCLVILTAYGCRMTEVYERRGFVAFIAEKTSRTQTEFMLHTLSQPSEQLGSANVASPERRQVSRVNRNAEAPQDFERQWSLDDTDSHTDSSLAFQGMGGPQRLQRIAKVGKQEHWLVPTAQLEMMVGRAEQKVGSGSITLVSGELHGSPVSVKVAWRTDLMRKEEEEALHLLLNEIRSLRHVRHPNIVTFLGACVDLQDGALAMVTERTQGRTLREVMNSGLAAKRWQESRQGAGGLLTKYGMEQNLVEDDVKHRILLDICRAVRYLHEHAPALVHGDLRDENVLVAGDGRTKLQNFGLSTATARDSAVLGVKVTPWRVPWLAPEVIAPRKICTPSTTADIFSFGRIVYYLAAGKPVSEDFTADNLIAMARTQKLPSLNWPAVPCKFTVQCKALAQKCMKAKPVERPPASEVLEDLRAWPKQFNTTAEGSTLGESNSFSHEVDIRPLEGWKSGIRRLKASAQNSGPLPTSMTSRQAAPAKGSKRLLGELPSITEDEGDAPAQGQVTPLSTRQLMLIDVVRSWRLPPDHKGCCRYHNALRDLHKVCRDLRAASCTPQFRHCEGFMCFNCGALSEKVNDGTDINCCDFCGQEQEQEAAPKRETVESL